MKKWYYYWQNFLGLLIIIGIISMIVYGQWMEQNKQKITERIDKIIEEDKKTLEKLEKDIDEGRIPMVSKIEILSFYLKPREYGNMQFIGELKNNHSIAVGVQLQATAYDKQGRIIDVQEFWPASIRNIPPGDVYPYDYFFNTKNVDRAKIRVIDVKVWK